MHTSTHGHIMGRQTNMHAYAYSCKTHTKSISKLSAEGEKAIVLSHFYVLVFEYNRECSVVLRTLNAYMNIKLVVIGSFHSLFLHILKLTFRFMFSFPSEK